MGKEITSRSEDYSQWYIDLVKKADLAENSDVRGCMVIKPYGYSIWEKMQQALDKVLYPAIDKFLQSQVAGIAGDLAEIARATAGGRILGHGKVALARINNQFILGHAAKVVQRPG